MCLEYLGAHFTEAEIASACGTRPRGTTFDEALAGLAKLGFEGEKHDDSTLDWLDERLRSRSR